ncbi:hypothetical protein [Streptomyces sp. NPDC004250]|uniref:hypothetical protein n=1 Tax=Streptomyces sp. NPDC004250 TaxID=3364692 RepID=UPI0036BCA165
MVLLKGADIAGTRLSSISHSGGNGSTGDLLISSGRLWLLVAAGCGTMVTAVAGLEPELVGGLIYVAAYAREWQADGDYNTHPGDVLLARAAACHE